MYYINNICEDGRCNNNTYLLKVTIDVVASKGESILPYPMALEGSRI
jgi:hypothetical protein